MRKRLAHPGRSDARRLGFTLVELLVVVSIIALLVSMLLPSLASARDQARSTTCRNSLHNIGVAVNLYQSENGDFFPPYMSGSAYFWGAPGTPVDVKASPFMKYLGNNLAHLWCPSQPYGTYVPQAGVSEPTTTYGYNAYCLDPGIWGRTDAVGTALPRKKASALRSAGSLFVFADSGLYWAPSGVPIFQNSTSLDPITTNWGPNNTATTHFRHLGKTNALCADGHAATYDLEGGTMRSKTYNLGFVGAANYPHYDVE